MVGWPACQFRQKMLPLCGSILQAETCQTLSIAENPRWSRVWQYWTLKVSIFGCPEENRNSSSCSNAGQHLAIVFTILDNKRILTRTNFALTNVPMTIVSCRPGKSCKLSSGGKLRILQYPQNSVIRDKGQRETCVLNVDGA